MGAHHNRIKRYKNFLVFLLILFLLMVRWIGWNEDSSFLLVISLVKDNRLDITKYYNFTGDRSVFNGQYYSSKEPLLAFLVSPPLYALDKIIPNEDFLEGEASANLNETVTILNENNKTKIARIFSVFFGSVVFGALTFVLLLKLIDFSEVKYFLFFEMIFISTLFFVYSTVFYTTILASFLIFLSFFILIERKYYFLSGLLIGLSLFSDPIAVPFIIVMLLFVFIFERSKIKELILGFLISTLPFFVYNKVVFNRFFTFPFLHSDPTIFNVNKLISMSNISIENVLTKIYGLTFSYFKGIFFFNPILFFLFLLLLKEKSRWSLVAFFSFIGLIFVSCFLGGWYGGSSFGPRYMVPSIPFILVSFKRFILLSKKNKMLKIQVIILAFISLFNTLLGFSTYWKTFYNPSMGINFPLELYEYYLPHFLKFGPRSLILEDLFMKNIPDIRFVGVEREEYFYNFYNYSPLILFFVVYTIFLIIFSKEIESLGNKIEKVMKMIWIGILLLAIFSYFWTSYIKPGIKGGYPENGNFWIKQKTRYTFYLSESSLYWLNFCTRNYIDEFKEIKVKFSNPSPSYIILSSNSGICHRLLFFGNKGRNTVEFEVNGNCRYPFVEEGISDYRCLSVFVYNLSVDKADKNKMFYSLSGLFPNSYDVSKQMKLIVYNPFVDHIAHLEISLATPFNQFMVLKNSWKNFYLYKGENYLTTDIYIKRGINVFDFEFEKCLPQMLVGSGDQRCVSATIKKISLKS